MKLALVLRCNPNVGGVLLIGPRGTGKTTAVRSLVDLLPEVPRGLCYYGCLPEDVETGGMDAICPDCARKFAEGEPLATMDRVRLVELPLNARLEDVIGGLDERAAVHQRMRLKRGILAQADQNLLYVDITRTWRERHCQQRRVELIKFSAATLALLLTFGIVLFVQHSGAHQLQRLIG